MQKLSNSRAKDKVEQHGLTTILIFDPEDGISEYYKLGFNSLYLSQRVDEFFLYDDQGNNLVYAPQDAIALVVPLSSETAPIDPIQLKFVVDELSLNIPIITHYPGLDLALHRMSQDQRRTSQITAQTMLQLAEIRKVHEELQNGYDALRSVISESGIALPRVGFTNIPDPDQISVKQDFYEIIQPIPVELRSLCGISLHIEGSVPQFAAGEIDIELFAPDDDEKRIIWRIPFASIARGWLTFAFEQKGVFLRRNVALRITRRALAGPGPLFSLGKTQLRPDKAAVVDGQRLSRSIALKAWVSVPGAPLNVSNQMWPVVRLDAKPINRIDVVIRDIEIVDVRRQNERANFLAVTRLDTQQRIVVHPVGQVPTIAQLVDACPPGTIEICAEVETDNEHAGLVEYGIALALNDLSLAVSDIDLTTFIESVNWIALPAKTHGTLSLPLDLPLTRTTDLVLMTRVPPGASSDNCWAHYKRVYFKGAFG